MDIKKIIKGKLKLIETIIYILVIIMTVTLYILGPIYIKFIPLLFILGIIGNIIFKRPWITAIFTFIVSLFVNEVFNVTSFTNNLLESSYTFIFVILGEFVGNFAKIAYQNKSKKVTSKDIKNYTYILVITSIALLFSGYIDGNLFNYLKSHEILTSYITNTYNILPENIIIKNDKYVNGTNNYYSFEIENLDVSSKSYTFGVYSDKYHVVDEFKLTNLEYSANKLTQELKFKNIILQEGYDISFTYDPITENLLFVILCDSTVNNNDMNTYIENSDTILKEVLNYNEFKDIVRVQFKYLTGDNKLILGEITDSYFHNIEKYKEAMNVEFIQN